MARGGKRPGSGRKSKPALPAPVKKDGAERVLAKLGAKHAGKLLPTQDELWLSLILGNDLRIRLDALRYLSDRRDGKPAQTVRHVGKTEDEPMRMIIEDVGAKK